MERLLATIDVTDMDQQPQQQPQQQNSYENHQSDDLYDVVERSRPKPTIPFVGGAIQNFLSDWKRLKHWSGKAIQFYLIWYLVTSIAKSVSEALEELAAENFGGNEPYFCSRSDLPRILQYLEDPIHATMTNLPRTVPILELGVNLMAAGLPIRSTSNAAERQQRTGTVSIESLFQELSRAEASILQQCLWNPPLSVRERPNRMWESIVGLEDVKNRLLLTVTSCVPPSRHRFQEGEGEGEGEGDEDNNNNSNSCDNNLVWKTQQAYATLLTGSDMSSTSQHHGVLLFGEPGCGKSFLVQALAAKVRWPCLVVTPSVLLRKYVGDTNLQVRALFSLLQKMGTCILVLDELDGIFRERHDLEHDASRELKTEFLQWMSGIMASRSSADQQLPMIVGATNRPSDVDSAILRRLPQRFYIGPPNYAARYATFSRMLEDVPLADDFDIAFLSQQTEGYTPSDIQQVLRTAASSGPLKDAMVFHQQQKQKEGSIDSLGKTVRPLTTQDVLEALSHVHATPLSFNYRRALERFANLNVGSEWAEGGNHDYDTLGYHYANLGTVQVLPPQDSTNFHNHQQHRDWDYEESYDSEDISDLDDDDL